MASLPSAEETEGEFLLLALECETGLFELLWRLATIAGDSPKARRLDLAKQSLRALLQHNYVTAVRTVWASKQPAGLVSVSDALVAIELDATWEDPLVGQPYLAVVATDLGEAHYFSGNANAGRS